MSDNRQKIQLELALKVTGKGEASTRHPQGSESLTAAHEHESLAGTEWLMQEVCDRENMKKALKRVRSNRGSAGVDGMTVDELPGHLEAHWPEIEEELLKGSYRPRPVKRVEIPKAQAGKVRILGIPCVLDRLVQQAVLQVLQPRWDPTFSEHSYGFRFTSGRRLKRGIAPQALQKFKKRVRQLTRRSRGVSLEQMVEQLARYLCGWLAYFSFCETLSVLRDPDSWIRRRLRSVVWKQWKTYQNRGRGLQRHGLSERDAETAAYYARDVWRTANSQPMKIALPNAFFDSIGLPRLAAP